MSEQAAWADDIVRLAKECHEIYEIEAGRSGWRSQTPFFTWDELPEANRQTMLNTMARMRTYFRNYFQQQDEKSSMFCPPRCCTRTADSGERCCKNDA